MFVWGWVILLPSCLIEASTLLRLCDLVLQRPLSRDVLHHVSFWETEINDNQTLNTEAPGLEEPAWSHPIARHQAYQPDKQLASTEGVTFLA